MTVFAYANDLRMELARELLLEGRQPIGEISAQVGYQNPPHFTAAFKSKYGLAQRIAKGWLVVGCSSPVRKLPVE